MRKIVVDSKPIISLSVINKLYILKQLYERYIYLMVFIRKVVLKAALELDQIY